MREPAGNPELPPVFFAQLNGHVAAEIRTPNADVDGDIQDLAAEHRHQLPLRKRILQVQPAQHAPGRAGQIVLDERASDSVLGVTGKLIRLEKKAALVPEQPGLDDNCPGNFGLNNIHFKPLYIC